MGLSDPRHSVAEIPGKAAIYAATVGVLNARLPWTRPLLVTALRRSWYSVFAAKEGVNYRIRSLVRLATRDLAVA